MTGEAKLQSECIKWFRLAYPSRARSLFAIPNGGSRNILEAYNLKRQGVLPGVPDMFLAIPKGTAAGMFIEMKHGKNGTTPQQREQMEHLGGNGYKCVVCHSFDEFKAATEEYLQ